MNLMFWKKKAGSGGDAESPQESPADEHKSPDPESADSGTPAKPGLVAKITTRLAALIRHFKKPPAFNAEENQAADATGHLEPESGDATPPVPPSLKRRLTIGGAIGLILLSGIGFAVWKIFLSTPNADTPAQVDATHAAKPVPQTEAAHAKIEALKKKNEELQAQIEALKKGQQQGDTESQQPVEPTAKQSKDTVLPSSDNGDLMVDNKDPKATAMSLKEAIDAMNEGYGDYGKKRAK
ncbi:MAG: hypothetical protein HY936_06490 [Nitrosomonadales bacterium]|nr:hypothetical protein [Nitrosomonadales bacterium]